MYTNPLIGQILLQVILIFLNAVFACAEIAVLTFNNIKLQKMAAEGNRRAIKLAALTSQPARFLATIQVAITFSGFLGSAFAADNFAERISGSLARLPFPAETTQAIAVVLVTLLLSFITLIFGELVPKRVAMKNAEKLALAVSGLVSFVSKAFAPIVWLLTLCTNGILRLLRINPDTEEDRVTKEDIRMMVDTGTKGGTIAAGEKEIIRNVFAFDDLTAGEISTHRTDTVMLEMGEPMEVWDKQIIESRFTCYPICDGDPDDIVGILNAKDYFRLTDKSRKNVMDSAVKPPYFVPETVKADVLFRNMKRQRQRFAVVLDEYGGVEGIITVSDLLERLVGEFDEESEAEDIERVDDDTWKIRGCAMIEDVEEELNVQLARDDYDTFGGFVIYELEAIPEDGSTFELDAAGLHIRVTKVMDHRIEQTVVSLIRSDPENGSRQDSERTEPDGVS